MINTDKLITIDYNEHSNNPTIILRLDQARDNTFGYEFKTKQNAMDFLDKLQNAIHATQVFIE